MAEIGEVEMKDAAAAADAAEDTKKERRKHVAEEAKADEGILAMDVDEAE